MKITIVGSAHSIHISKIANHLAEAGHIVSVFSEEPSNHPLSPQSYHPGVQLFDKWPTHKKTRKGLFLLKLNWHCLVNRVDVVWLVYASSYGLLAGKIFGARKIVSSVWGSDILVNAYKKGSGVRIAAGLNKADLVLSTSRFLRLHTYRLTDTPIEITPYGPQDDFFDSGNETLSSSERESVDKLIAPFNKVVLCTKWLKHVYGVDILIEAVSQDREYFRKNNIGVIIAGDGQDSGSLSGLVKEHSIEDVVVFAGYLTQAKIIELLDRAAVSVFPSRSESFGVSVLESFARRTPVIMSDAGGFREIGAHGKYGIQINSFEPADYLAAIKSVLSGEVEYDLESAAAYAEGFRWSNCVELTSHYLSKLVENTTPHKMSSNLGVDNRPKVLYSHSESPFCEKDLSRARALRVSGMRDAFSKDYELIELAAGMQTGGGLKKMIAHLFQSNDFDFVYIEGSSSATVGASLAKLKYILENARKYGVRVVFYLPDAHEFWDDYLLSAGDAYFVHLARWRKARLLKLLVDSRVVTIGVPTKEFRTALIPKLPDHVRSPFSQNDWVELPPAMTEVRGGFAAPSSQFKFVYAGGLGAFYRIHRWLLAIQGPAGTHAEHELVVRARDLSNLEFNFRELVHASGACIKHGQLPLEYDGHNVIGILLIEPTEYSKAGFPVKFFSYLQRGWPIIAFENTVIGDLVEKHQLGWVFPRSVKSIEEFLENKDYEREYESCKKNVLEYRITQTWGHRAELIRESAQ